MYDSKVLKKAPALDANTFINGNVRIQFLTERLVRLEWQESGNFEDRQTPAVVNRNLGDVNFTHKKRNGRQVLKTGKLTLELSGDSQPLSKNNLKITFKMNGKNVEWKPGDSPSGNLGGTARSLDCANGGYRMLPSTQTGMRPERQVYEYQPVDLGHGFLSRDGWSLIDDSANAVIESVKGFKWFGERHEGNCQDWYFFAYGHDYTFALSDAAQVFGRQPLPPRYTLGYWWSRYWPYSDLDLEELVRSFENNKTPLDVMVIDTDWHLPGWTGYTWDKSYFPDPDGHLKWLHKNGVRVSLNLHPDAGVGKHEEQFRNMCKAMGLDPKKTDNVPFELSNPKYMDSYFKLLHHPEEKRGIDFWWMDWAAEKKSGLDPLCCINQLHWEDMEERGGKRPMIFSRFGSFGSGRYNIGFSGDTYSTWESLAYQTYFTATAANILFGYWSHDIGGFQRHSEPEPELYTRWLQYGALSPILRTHCSKTSAYERRAWKYPDPYSGIMSESIRMRRRMIPYIYSENRKAFDTALSLCRPMYYHWAEEENAYKYQQQYMFGSEMIAAPIVTPGDSRTGMASADIWLPDGEWFDTARGCMEKGGQIITRHYMLQEIPLFVRPGTVIPEQQDGVKLNRRCYKKLALSIYPGANGSYDLYEDDGISQEYLKDAYAVIKMFQKLNGNIRTIQVIRKSGSFDGYEAERSLELRIKGTVPPVSIKFGTHKLAYIHRLDEADEAWTYDARHATAVVKIKAFNLDKGIEVKAVYRDADIFRKADGLCGIFNRLEQIKDLGVSLCFWQSLHPDERMTQELFSTANRISRHPETFDAELDKLHEGLDLLPEIADRHSRLGPDNKVLPSRLADGIRILEMLEEIKTLIHK